MKIPSAIFLTKGFPTLEQVEQADIEQLARWYRVLILPTDGAANQKLMNRIKDVFTVFAKVGGEKFTAFIVERGAGSVSRLDAIPGADHRIAAVELRFRSGIG